uniref:Reverse transcriptase domain-containing protein n=1 Tax=Monopterus albus TaxID=43700 RepID=A0A3Q3ILF6_MONAL
MRLDEPITKEELEAAISALQSGKSPGPDGFPAEFFKTFSSLLAPQLSTVLADSVKQGRLPASFYEALSRDISAGSFLLALSYTVISSVLPNRIKVQFSLRFFSKLLHKRLQNRTSNTSTNGNFT